MSNNLATFIKDTCQSVGNDRTRLMDVAESVQARFGHVSSESMDLIATQLKMPRVEVEGLVTFYAFLSKRPKGAVVVRVCNDVVDRMNGGADVAAAFEKELGIRVGETTPDGRFTLERVYCVGNCAVGPSLMIDEDVYGRVEAADVARLLDSYR